MAHLEDLVLQGSLTLLTATKDPTISHAGVLAERLAGERGIDIE
jgi:uncharacterized protein YeaO (DUF488 family)